MGWREKRKKTERARAAAPHVILLPDGTLDPENVFKHADDAFAYVAREKIEGARVLRVLPSLRYRVDIDGVPHLIIREHGSGIEKRYICARADDPDRRPYVSVPAPDRDNETQT